MAVATPRVSAPIIPFPNAAPAPVVQRGGSGRRPRNVVSLRRFRIEQWDRRMAEQRRSTRNNAEAFVAQVDRLTRQHGKDWPFRFVTPERFSFLPSDLRAEMEGMILALTQQC